MDIKEKIAKAVRVISAPPFMITGLIIILAANVTGIFRNTADIVISILLLGFVPVLAYILQPIIPGLREQGRDGQRKLAFILNLVGYTAALLWALISGAEYDLLLICLLYFISVVLLTICNKCFHFKASGHASCFTGPLIILIYFLGWKVVLPCILFAVLISWSSIYLKRHTLKELAAGMGICILAFIISLFIIMYCRSLGV